MKKEYQLNDSAFIFSFLYEYLQKFYNDIDEANEAVKQGGVVGAMYFASNFSRVLQNNRDSTVTSREPTTAGEITISLDMGSTLIKLFALSKKKKKIIV